MLTIVLTGDGRGLPTSTDPASGLFPVRGPWGSPLPSLPSQPSQVYEGIATLAILAVLSVVLHLGAFRRRDGRLFFVAIGLWAVARAAVSTTWRDPVVALGLDAGVAVAVGIAIGSVLAVGWLHRAAARFCRRLARDRQPDVVWPDPATRLRDLRLAAGRHSHGREYRWAKRRS